MPTPYLRHSDHAEWCDHYAELYTGTRHLMMAEDWFAENMEVQAPKSGRALRVVYCDRESADPAFRHECSIYTAWDTVESLHYTYRLDAVPMPKVRVLQGYFYNCHHCPCHRIQDVLGWEAADSLPCEGNRFPIEKIYAPHRPYLVLYSETLTDKELEALLEKDDAT